MVVSMASITHDGCFALGLFCIYFYGGMVHCHPVVALGLATAITAALHFKSSIIAMSLAVSGLLPLIRGALWHHLMTGML